MAQGNYGTSNNPLEAVHGEQWVYTPLTSDPAASEREKGSTWFRSDLDSGDKIGTLRLQNDDAGTDIDDIPVFAESETTSGIVKARPIQTPNGEGFVPYQQEGGAFNQLRFQHNGTWYGAHSALAAIPDSGISRWTLDTADTSGTTSTDTWGTNDGTINGATTGVAGANQTYTTNEAYSFDGTDDQVTLPAIPALNPGSMACWMKYQGPAGGDGGDFHILSFFENNFTTLKLDGTDGAIQYTNFAGSTTELVGPIPTVGTWYHIVGTFDGTNMTLYVDATQEDTGTSGGVNAGNDGDAFGYRPNSGEYFEGDLDDIRLYSKALTSTEVTSLYNTGSIA